MKNFIFLLIGLILSLAGAAQSCLPEGITFSTQNQIDSFPITYPNCTRIDGNVNIVSGFNITNLNGLHGLTSIGGYLWIKDNPNLMSLEGLANLTSVESHLVIQLNAILTNLAGFAKMKNISGNFSIVSNPFLTSLDGLEGITSIGGTLSISYCDRLSDIHGLKGLILIAGGLNIYDNIIILNLSGLENLKSIGEYFWVGDNPAMSSLSGLDNLTSVGKSFFIGYQPALTNLDVLKKLDSIGGKLTITHNLMLSDLTGLENLNASTITDLSITYNDSLSNCAVKSICDYLASPNGTFKIHDNAIGCNSQVEVDSICKILSVEDLTINGRLSVFPNPASTKIIFETHAKGKLTILNLSGQKILQQQITEPTTTIDISEFKSGVYFVRVIGVKNVMTGKFIKN